MKNPFQCNLSGDWFFFDETEDVNGPYDTEEEAKAALDEYVFWLETGFTKYAAQMAHGV